MVGDDVEVLVLVFFSDVGGGGFANDGREVGGWVVECANDVAYTGFGGRVELVVVLAGTTVRDEPMVKR